MEKPKQVERYGKKVWEISKIDQIRRDNCMCLHCLKLKPGEKENCQIAQKLFEICQKHGNAMIVTRCEEWAENTKR